MAMDSILLNGLFFLFLFFVFFRFNVVRPFDQINNDCLSLEKCLSYRGVAAIVVFLSHAAYFVNDKTEVVLFKSFAVVGYLSVSIFFFLSGYGVMKKYMKDENYEKTFVKKRMCSILVPYAIFLVLYWAYRSLYGFVSPKDVLSTYITGLPIVSNSWYVVVIFIFYLIFFLQIKLFKRKYRYFVISGILINCAWIFLCRKIGYGLHWYNTTHIILIGFIWALKEEQIKEAMTKYKVLYIYIVIILLMLLFFCIFGINIQRKIFFFVPSKYLMLMYGIYTSIVFLLFTLFFNLRFITGNIFSKWIGKISFEIYLIHGLFLDLFKSKYISIESTALYVYLSLIVSIIAAFLIHYAINFIMHRIFNFCEHKQCKLQD